MGTINNANGETQMVKLSANTLEQCQNHTSVTSAYYAAEQVFQCNGEKSLQEVKKELRDYGYCIQTSVQDAANRVFLEK